MLKATAETLGASGESLHFMLSEHDGMVVVKAPDSVTMAAFVATALGSVALASAQTHELFTPDQLGEVLAKAGSARAAYRQGTQGRPERGQDRDRLHGDNQEQHRQPRGQGCGYKASC